MAGKIVSLVSNYVLPILIENNFELYDIEFVKESNQYFLRVYIDSDNGININDCEKVSRTLSKILDEKDPIEHEYILEVSSPGIERILKTDAHYKKYIGHNIKINLYKPFENHKIYEGKLLKADLDNIEIEFEQHSLSIPRKIISSCRLIFDKGENKIE